MGILYEAGIVERAINFGYANARVKAMKGLLLSEKETVAMMDAKNPDEVYSLLEKTPYRQDLVGSAMKGRSISDQIELACTKNFSRLLKKIRALTPKDAQKKMDELFEKYDIENLKTILITKHLGEGKETAASLITETGVLSKGLLNRMLDAKGLKEAVAELGGTPYGSLLEKAMGKYGKEREINTLISSLDEYYYRKLPQIVRNPYGDERIILNMLKAQGDLKNVSNVLRAKKAGMKEDRIAELLISGGSITRDSLMQAASAKNVEEAAKAFEKNYKIGKALEEFRKTGSLIPVEVEIEKGIAKKALTGLRTSVLSLGAIAGFLLLKEQEVANIRKICRAKEFSLPAEKIMEMVVLV